MRCACITSCVHSASLNLVKYRCEKVHFPPSSSSRIVHTLSKYRPLHYSLSAHCSSAVLPCDKIIGVLYNQIPYCITSALILCIDNSLVLGYFLYHKQVTVGLPISPTREENKGKEAIGARYTRPATETNGWTPLIAASFSG